jgi:hypothetical protein
MASTNVTGFRITDPPELERCEGSRYNFPTPEIENRRLKLERMMIRLEADSKRQDSIMMQMFDRIMTTTTATTSDYRIVPDLAKSIENFSGKNSKIHDRITENGSIEHRSIIDRITENQSDRLAETQFVISDRLSVNQLNRQTENVSEITYQP